MPAKPDEQQPLSQQGLTDAASREAHLLACIVHEISNPLAAIMAHLELLLADRRSDPVVREHLDVIIPQLIRLLSILDRTRGYAIAAIDARSPVDVGETLRAVVALLQYHYRAGGVQIALDVAERLPKVVGNAAHLQQAWVNYLRNSFNAIRRKGTEGNIRINAMADKLLRRVAVDITDDGAGMDADTLKLLNEGRRPGGVRWIGTAEAARIVAEHGGTVDVFSAPGRGTTVRVALPAAPHGENSSF